MKILSHRGWWLQPAEKNSVPAFQRSIEGGYGTETDIRDLFGQLVVSHDPPMRDALPWEHLLDLFTGTRLPLAVNVKADGLGPALADSMRQRDIPWFAFDMSGPEAFRYATAGVPFYTRHSDIEPDPILYREASGVWLDGMRSDWFEAPVIERHLMAGKAVCVVSPELHGRDPRFVWDWLAAVPGDVTLCTDYPDQASQMIDQ
ncbi:phosphodiesterase [Methylobacterium sp. WL18]|uniref:phosphodiesterase n=1 Tax=Methylobacterium sp. WL18 TaxID=2603897 RepID=UPI0011C74E30|nr:phosphodiesterase [Methylobacterium sp. WL18]TXN75964.1 phosphodiesterase [Methylobacterium sp. WL18]